MKKEILFTERQKFNQWWIWLILIIVNILFLVGTYIQMIEGQPFGNKPMSDEGLLFTTGIVMLLSILPICIRLETRIMKDGVYVKFFPFHLSFRRYSWDNIFKSYVRDYKPLTEYGGWGIRIGIFGQGRAFNITGEKGLQLEFINKRKLLIGTNKPDELKAALTKIGQLKM